MNDCQEVFGEASADRARASVDTAANAPIIARATNFTEWRAQARELLAADVPPSAVTWQDGDTPEADLFATPESGALSLTPSPNARRLAISRQHLQLLQRVSRYRIRHDESGRWPLLYQAVWRVSRGDHSALHAADRDGAILHRREHAVRREAHHMHAFLRFHRCANAGGERYLAWFEPAHDVLDLGAEHFADRLGGSRFIIATPDGGACWDGQRMDYRTPCPAAWSEAARAVTTTHGADGDHALWRTYFVSTFNPARLNHRVMTQHMPQRFWRHLSEGDLIPVLEARARHGGRRLAQEASVGRRRGKTLPAQAPKETNDV